MAARRGREWGQAQTGVEQKLRYQCEVWQLGCATV